MSLENDEASTCTHEKPQSCYAITGTGDPPSTKWSECYEEPFKKLQDKKKRLQAAAQVLSLDDNKWKEYVEFVRLMIIAHKTRLREYRGDGGGGGCGVLPAETLVSLTTWRASPAAADGH